MGFGSLKGKARSGLLTISTFIKTNLDLDQERH